MNLMIFIVLLLTIVTLFSYIHGIGLWLLLMIIHGVIYQSVGHGSEHLPLMAGLIVMTIILVKRKWSGVSKSIMLLFTALIMLMALSSLQGIDQNTSITTMFIYARGFMLVILLAGCLKNEQDMKIMTLYCLAGLTIGALAALYQYKTGKFTIHTIYEHRSASLRGDPNDTAMLLVAGIPLTFYWLYNYKRLLGTVFFSGIMVALLFGIVLTGSRGGFVALLAVASIMFIRKPSLKVFLAGIFLAASFLAIAPHSYWDRMDTMRTGHEEHGSRSLKNRERLQMGGLNVFMEHPVFGVGPGNFGQAYLQYLGFQQAGGGVAHNMYLEFFVENGFFGGMLLLYIYATSIMSLLKLDRIQGRHHRQFGLGFSIAVSLFGMLLSGLFLSQAKNSVLWFTIGMGISAGLIANKIKKDAHGYELHDAFGQVIPEPKSSLNIT